MFFLHDQMYDLVERHVWQPDRSGYMKQALLDGVIIAWYAEQIESLDQEICRDQNWQKRGEIRREQQLLITEQLYYQFDQDSSCRLP